MRITSIAIVVLTLCVAAPAHAQLPAGAPSYDTLVANARALSKSGRYAEALNVCEQAIARANSRFEAYVAAASAYAGDTLFDEAVGMLQAALVRAPQDKKPLVRNAITYIRQQLEGAGNAGIAYVDGQRVIMESALGKHYSAQVSAEWAKARESWEAKNREVQTLERRIAQSRTVIADQALNKMNSDLARLQRELKEIETKMYADNDALQERLKGELEARLRPVVTEVAAAQNVRVVFSAENLLWADPATDLTTQTIKALDAKGIK